MDAPEASRWTCDASDRAVHPGSRRTYYAVDVLPGWLQVLSHFSPATYLLRGIRDALIDGRGISDQIGTLLLLGVFGVVMVPGSLIAFSAAERWAKKTGRLKRQG